MIEAPANEVTSLSVSADELFARSSWPLFYGKILNKVKESGGSHLLSITVKVAPVQPLQVIQRCASPDAFRFYWEKPDHHIGLCAGKALLTLSADGPDRFARLSQAICSWQQRSFTYPEDIPGQPLFVGGFSFFDEFRDERWRHFHNGLFVVPEWVYFREDKNGYFTVNLIITPASGQNEAEQQFAERLEQWHDRLIKSDGSETGLQAWDRSKIRNGSPEAWKGKVGEIIRRIRAEEFGKVVLARSVQMEYETPADPGRLLEHLREAYPDCYQFWIQPEKTASFFGSSPERLAAFRNGYIVTESLAGSISRDPDEQRDKELALELRQSSKDQSEHRFVVDEIIGHLRRFTKQLYALDQPRILRYPNVQHLYTPITGRLKPGTNPLDVIGHLHPTPAVGGVPRKQVLELIKDMEPFERGWYAGPVGWLDRTGNGEFSVAIRSSLLTEKKAEIYAGCGIVADSDPQAEWEETELKLIPLLSAFRSL